MDTNGYTHAESLPSPRLSKDKFSKSKDGEKILLDTRGQVESGQRWQIFKRKALSCLWLAGTSGTLAHETKPKKNDKHDYIHWQASAQKRKPLTEGRQNLEKGRKHDILSSDRWCLPGISKELMTSRRERERPQKIAQLTQYLTGKHELSSQNSCKRLSPWQALES